MIHFPFQTLILGLIFQKCQKKNITRNHKPLHLVTIPSTHTRLPRKRALRERGVTCLLPKLPSKPTWNSSNCLVNVASIEDTKSFSARWNATSSEKAFLSNLDSERETDRMRHAGLNASDWEERTEARSTKAHKNQVVEKRRKREKEKVILSGEKNIKEAVHDCHN